MPDLMPQEVAVWYLIPSIRKELAKELTSRGLTQKKTAELLGLTEAAISQYQKNKRAQGYSFDKSAEEKIKKTADKILKDQTSAKKHIYKLSNELMKSKVVCKIHKTHDKTLTKNCKICFE